MNHSKYFSRFLTSEEALSQRFRTQARQMRFRGGSRIDVFVWQKKARQRFARHLGLNRFQRCDPKAKKIGRIELDDLIREEWRIQTEANVWMPYYLFIPKQFIRDRLPLVLCPHGHESGGKWATGGRMDIPEMRSTIKKYHYDYGLQIARTGFITVCPDARGFGERREPLKQTDRKNPDFLHASSCHNLSLAGAPLGLTVQGMWTWDLMRLLDHLCNDLRIDLDRVGCAGLSGGGMQTLDLAALDSRIRAAVVSGYFYGVRESLQVMNENCMCNMVPHLWEDFDMGDIGALIAPRGLFIETGDQDPLNGSSCVTNVRGQVAITRKIFRALSCANQLRHYVFHGDHRWDGTRSISWLKQKLHATG